MQLTESVIIHDKLRAGLPTVLLLVGQTPLDKLLEFFREKCVSLSTERTYAQAVGKFIEWLSVRAEEFKQQDKRSLLYTAFAHDLRFGTYQDGEDLYGLNWRPTSDLNLKRLCRALMEFSDWLNMRYGSALINPMHQDASYVNQMIFWRAWNKHKAGSLLAHTKSRAKAFNKSFLSRQSQLPKSKSGFMEEAKAFPADKVEDLLWKGFINPKNSCGNLPWFKYNLRDILISLLCIYGGCRASEPLHLWVGDVFVDPESPDVALVLIHEPSDGKFEYIDPITGKNRKTSRAEYLQIFCDGLKPLTQETGRRHSGWKGCLLTHRERGAFQVFWIDKNAGRLFLTLWRLYIQHVRPPALRMPWAFLTKDAQPLGMEGFDDSFRAAVRRIGLKPSKWAGTSSHGLRHRYGQWLNELGLGEKEGQVAMHHLNAKSQQVYRQIGVNKVAEAIGKLNVNVPLHLKDAS